MPKIETASFPPEKVVIHQDEDAEFMYILKDGEMAVKVRDENGIENYVNILKRGAIFGEVALISNCKRTATV